LKQHQETECQGGDVASRFFGRSPWSLPRTIRSASPVFIKTTEGAKEQPLNDVWVVYLSMGSFTVPFFVTIHFFCKFLVCGLQFLVLTPKLGKAFCFFLALLW
jgi:hypothetical protein